MRLSGIVFSKTHFGFRYIGNNIVILSDELERPLVTVGPHWPGLLFTVVMIGCGTVLNLNILRDHANGKSVETWLRPFIFLWAFASLLT